MPTHYLSHIKDHLNIAKGYLPEQYKNRPNIDGLLTAITLPLQDIEDELYEMYKNHSLREARGYYLDRIGALVGELRNYRPDAEYKPAILARIMINNAGGTPEDIISAINFTFNPRQLSYTEIYPACFSVFIQTNSIDRGFKNVLKSISPIGISDFVFTYSPEDNPFMFAECSSEITALKVKVSIEDDEDFNMEVNTGLKVTSFNVVAETQSLSKGYIGFAEVIGLDNYTINGGSKLAEVIGNV